MLAVWLTLRLVRWWRRVQGGLLRRRGIKGERSAEKLLERRGYRVLDRQARAIAHVIVDGARRETEIVADLLVERDARRYVVEVKTGAARSLSAGTRRQLLEYWLAFEADGVLLADATDGHVMEIDFEYRQRGAAEVVRHSGGARPEC